MFSLSRHLVALTELRMINLLAVLCTGNCNHRDVDFLLLYFGRLCTITGYVTHSRYTDRKWTVLTLRDLVC